MTVFVFVFTRYALVQNVGACALCICAIYVCEYMYLEMNGVQIKSKRNVQYIIITCTWYECDMAAGAMFFFLLKICKCRMKSSVA